MLKLGMGWLKKYMLSNFPNFNPEFNTVYKYIFSRSMNDMIRKLPRVHEERNAFDAFMDQTPSNM